MEWIVNNWILIVALLCVSAAVVCYIIKFFKLPSEKQIANVKEWLKWAVVQAEKELGGGTGQLKLRMVYDLAVNKFPWISKLVSFDTFSIWVDDALVWMEKQLSSNKNISAIVEGN